MEEEGIFVLSPLRKEFRWFRSRDTCICTVYYAVNRMENCDNSRFVTISSWMEWNRFVVFLFRRIILLCILGYVHFRVGPLVVMDHSNGIVLFGKTIKSFFFSRGSLRTINMTI